jgi:hypothetical protein
MIQILSILNSYFSAKMATIFEKQCYNFLFESNSIIIFVNLFAAFLENITDFFVIFANIFT